MKRKKKAKNRCQIIDTVSGVKVDTKSNLKIQKKTIEVLIDDLETVGYSYFLFADGRL